MHARPARLATLLALAAGLGCGDPPTLAELGVPDTLALPRVPFEAVAGAEPDTGRFNVAVTVESVHSYFCPPCPSDAECGPCDLHGDYIYVAPAPPRPTVSPVQVCTGPPVADVLDEAGHSGTYVASLHVRRGSPDYDPCFSDGPVQLLGLSPLRRDGPAAPGGAG